MSCFNVLYLQTPLVFVITLLGAVGGAEHKVRKKNSFPCRRMFIKQLIELNVEKIIAIAIIIVKLSL